MRVGEFLLPVSITATAPIFLPMPDPAQIVTLLQTKAIEVLQFFIPLWDWFQSEVISELEPRDWIALVGMTVAFVTFWLKLKTDATAARYRETIGFLDKNTATVLADWTKLEATHKKNPTSAEVPDEAATMLGLIDTAALLIHKKAIDGELVYNYWWKYVVTPMEFPSVEKWVLDLRRQDRAVLEHYCALQAKWKKRVDKERKGGLAEARKQDRKGVSAAVPIAPAIPPEQIKVAATEDEQRSLGLVATPALIATEEKAGSDAPAA